MATGYEIVTMKITRYFKGEKVNRKPNDYDCSVQLFPDFNKLSFDDLWCLNRDNDEELNQAMRRDYHLVFLMSNDSGRVVAIPEYGRYFYYLATECDDNLSELVIKNKEALTRDLAQVYDQLGKDHRTLFYDISNRATTVRTLWKVTTEALYDTDGLFDDVYEKFEYLGIIDESKLVYSTC